MMAEPLAAGSFPSNRGLAERYNGSWRNYMDRASFRPYPEPDRSFV
jgi:hypothetical protein